MNLSLTSRSCLDKKYEILFLQPLPLILSALWVNTNRAESGLGPTKTFQNKQTLDRVNQEGEGQTSALYEMLTVLTATRYKAL